MMIKIRNSVFFSGSLRPSILPFPRLKSEDRKFSQVNHMGKGAKHLGPPLLLSHVRQQGASSETVQSEQVSKWDSSIVGSNFTCYVTTLAPTHNIIAGLSPHNFNYISKCDISALPFRPTPILETYRAFFSNANNPKKERRREMKDII